MSKHRAAAPPRWWLRPLIVGVLGLVAVLSATASAGTGVRAVGILMFLLAGPGLAIVGLLGLVDRWQELTFVVAVSLAIDVLVMGALAYAGDANPAHSLAVLLVIAGVGVAVQTRLRPTRRSAQVGSQ